MALKEKNCYWLCGILVYMIIIITASPTNRREISINESEFSTTVTYNNTVCWTDNVAYNNEDVVPGAGPCEQCICNAPDIVCSIIKCNVKTGCKIIQKQNQCCPDYKCDCEYNGRTYYNGEKINTADTPCRVCYCKGGDVMCTTVGCYERDDCEGKMVPGTCCPKYDHCPPLDENNKNVKITQTKTDALILRNGSRGLQPGSLSTNVGSISELITQSDVTTGHAELTMVMKRINNLREDSSENFTSEIADNAHTETTNVAREARNTVKISTSWATPVTENIALSQRRESVSIELPESPSNVSQCAHVSEVSNDDLITAVFTNTETTDKSQELFSSTPENNDPLKTFVEMEKSTIAILQQLLDAKTTIEPLAAETSDVITTTVESIATQSGDLHDTTNYSLLNLLGNDLTIYATVLQSENASRHASAMGDDVEDADVRMVDKDAKITPTEYAPITEEVTENAVVKLIEKEGLTKVLSHTKFNEKTTLNRSEENVITATANVTVIDDRDEGSTTTVASSQMLPTNKVDFSNTSVINEAPEIGQVTLIGKNDNTTTTWEDLGAVVAHVTVLHKEENKIDSDLNSSNHSGEFSSETDIDLYNSSENLFTLPIPVDNVTNIPNNRSHSNEFTNGAVHSDDSYLNFPITDFTDVVTLTPPTWATITTTVNEHINSNIIVQNFTQLPGAETTDSNIILNSNNVETTTNFYTNDSRINFVEFLTSESPDLTAITFAEETPSSRTTNSNTLSDNLIESAQVTTRFENGNVDSTVTYTTINRSNSSEIDNVQPKQSLNTSLSSETNIITNMQQLPFDSTTIKADGIITEGNVSPVVTNASTTTLPIFLNTSSNSTNTHTKTEIPTVSVNVENYGENKRNDTVTTSTDFIDSVTFTNQIRLDVADQLPQSFFVEAFHSPTNYTIPSSDSPSSSDFPFEIFFNTNFSDVTSNKTDNFNISPSLLKFDNVFNSTNFNFSTFAVTTNETTGFQPSDNSNYTKIFAQKVVLHPIKLFNSVNSVYLSPGLGFWEVTSASPFPNATNQTETFSNSFINHYGNNTEYWNSTEDTTVPYELTTTVFEDYKVTDSPWRNVSLPNYKILLDSLNEGKIKPLTKVPKVTVVPLSWLKNSVPASFYSSVTNSSSLKSNATIFDNLDIPSNKNDNASISEETTVRTEVPKKDIIKNESRTDSPQAKVYDPLMPYPEEYPEEYQTIQNGPAIIITRTTYTRIPDVTYTTVTMATLPTYQQVQKAEDGFANTLFERKFRERSFSNGENMEAASSTTENTRNAYFNIDVKRIEEDDKAYRRHNVPKGKGTSDRRMPDPVLNDNHRRTSTSTKNINLNDAKKSNIPALDDKDLKIVQNFMNKHLRLR